MNRVKGRDGREWVIRKEILWANHNYKFDCETDGGLDNIIVPSIVLALAIIVILSSPPWIPLWFICFLLLSTFSIPLFWINNKHRRVTAICGLEEWSDDVRGWRRSRMLVREVTTDIRNYGSPIELERIH
jgi:hypothetical protein